MAFKTVTESLAGTITQTQAAAERCTRELIKVCKRYDLTPAGAEGERQRLYADVITTQEQAEARAAELIDAEIAAVDAEEQRAAERRAADTEYMHRLQMKINMIGSVDIQKLNDATIRAMFEEFTDDPLAIEMIRAAIPGGRTVRIEPANSCGKAQAHLQEVKKAIIRAIRKAGEYISPEDLESGNIPFKSEVDALTAYILAQTETFSKDDATTWAGLVKNGTVSEVDAWLWKTRFSNSR